MFLAKSFLVGGKPGQGTGNLVAEAVTSGGGEEVTRSGQREGLPLEMVRAGDHCDRRISRQMLPLLLIFGW